MKFRISAVAAALLSTGARAECPFCPDGLAVVFDTAVPESDGQTCGTLAGFAPALALDDDYCSQMKLAEPLCCPAQAAAPADPCPVCPDGPAAEMAAVAVPEAQGLDCAGVVAYAQTVAAGTEACAELEPAAVEGFCCPTPAAKPCPVCSDGITAEEGTVLPDSDGLTCEAGLAFAQTFEEGSDDCDEALKAEGVCCPAGGGGAGGLGGTAGELLGEAGDLLGGLVDGAGGLGDTAGGLLGEAGSAAGGGGLGDLLGGLVGGAGDCAPCADGFEVDADSLVNLGGGDAASGFTCQQLAAGLGMVPAGPGCDASKSAIERACCRSQAPPAECAPCADGFEVDADAVVDLPGEATGPGLTCQQIADGMGMLPKGPECDASKFVIERACCPAQTAPPCAFCPAGLDNPDTVMPDSDSEDSEDGETCGSMAGYANMMSSDDPNCAMLTPAEMLCCPAQVQPAADPCPFCPAGLDDADTVVPDSDGRTCGFVAGYAATTPSDSPICAEMKPVEMLCCPAQVQPAADPCPFCPAGLSVAADTVVPDSDGRTCGFIAGYASVITPDDPICAEIEPAEWVCCPAAAAATGATAAVITTTAATVAAPATTTATVAATTGVPEGVDVTDPDSGAAGVGWVEASISTVAVAMLVLFG